MPFTTTCMDLEGIMPSEVSQRRINIISLHLYGESKNQNKKRKSRNRPKNAKNKLMVAGGAGDRQKWLRGRGRTGFQKYRMYKSQG